MTTSRTPVSAKATISPDRGDDRIGVTVKIKGHVAWLPLDAAAELETEIKHALTAARRQMRSL